VISTEGLLTVHEAAKRVNRSTEQVRRYLREGKLKGQRIGNQWFVEQDSLRNLSMISDRLIPKELMEEIDELRERIFRRNGVVFDVVEMLRRDRESH
jgi:excisionase family DNA binding protein